MRYTLRVPQAGDYLYGDGDTAVVADTREQARQFLEEETGEPVPYLHSYIGSCRIVYKRDWEACDCHDGDWEACDCHDGAEPGDTTVDYCVDDRRELRSHECRVWLVGAPRLARWKMEPIAPLPIAAGTIPAGAPVSHARLGRGESVGAAVRICGQWYLPCAFGEKTRACEIRARGFSVYYSAVFGSDWAPPPTRYRLTINGEHVADGSERMLTHLVDIREARLRAEWEAAQDRELQAATA